MLKFTMIMRVEASKWSSEEEKQIFMMNAQDVVQQGLEKMTVPDWTITILDVEEE